MSKITALEARLLAGLTVGEALEEAYAAIRDSAAAGRRNVNLEGEFWSIGGVENLQQWQDAVKTLRDLGFLVRFNQARVAEESFTIIEW